LNLLIKYLLFYSKEYNSNLGLKYKYGIIDSKLFERGGDPILMQKKKKILIVSIN